MNYHDRKRVHKIERFIATGALVGGVKRSDNMQSYQCYMIACIHGRDMDADIEEGD